MSWGQRSAGVRAAQTKPFVCLRSRRKVVWPLLLGVFSWDSTPKDRSDFCQAVRETYDSINRQVAAQQFGSVGDRAHFHQQVGVCRMRRRRDNLTLSLLFFQQVETITLDVQRADRAFHSPSVEGRASDTTERLLRILQAYIFLNRYPGYAQGMSGELFSDSASEMRTADVPCAS